MMIIFIWKNGKIHLKMCKTSIFTIFFPCLYNFTLLKYRKDPDPVRIFRIRILPKRFGSGSATLAETVSVDHFAPHAVDGILVGFTFLGAPMTISSILVSTPSCICFEKRRSKSGQKRARRSRATLLWPFVFVLKLVRKLVRRHFFHKRCVLLNSCDIS